MIFAESAFAEYFYRKCGLLADYLVRTCGVLRNPLIPSLTVFIALLCLILGTSEAALAKGTLYKENYVFIKLI